MAWVLGPVITCILLVLARMLNGAGQLSCPSMSARTA